MKAEFALIVFTLAGCATVPTASAESTTGLGRIAMTNGLKVRPLRVLEDSRCPINAVCVWAGRLVVRTEVIGGSWRETHDLEMGKSQQVADGALTLISVRPSKQAGAEIDPRAYRFTFDFQGGL